MSARNLVAVAVTLALLGCSGGKPDVPFSTYSAGYEGRMDFARLEHRFPLTRTHLKRLTPKNLETLTQEEIDQVYARLTAGPIPDGAYEGTFFFSKGGGLERLPEVLGGLKGSVVDLKLDFIERLGGLLWEGKVFYRDRRLLRNMIQNRPSVKVLLKKLDVDPEKLETIEVAGDKRWLLFPARLYCGQSLLDGRRESILIDYMFTDELPGYQAGIDRLGGRDGTSIRDEIRMVRPGFYLGRAHLNRVFALNFTLLNRDVEAKGTQAFVETGRIEEDCYVGTQRLLASR